LRSGIGTEMLEKSLYHGVSEELCKKVSFLLSLMILALLSQCFK